MATDWDKELAKIDKQLASVSDEELARASAPPPARAGAAPPRAAATGAPVATPPPRTTRGWAVWLRILAAVAVGVGVVLWPYPKSCGAQLVGYLGATGVATLAGIWASVWSWRHRTAIGHLAGLAVMGTGLTLAALEVLPRIGYAYPSPGHPSNWSCEAPNVTGGASTTPTAPAPQAAPAQPQAAPQQQAPQLAPQQAAPQQAPAGAQPAPTQPAAPAPAPR
jgi:hypothetical protein